MIPTGCTLRGLLELIALGVPQYIADGAVHLLVLEHVGQSQHLDVRQLLANGRGGGGAVQLLA